MLSVALVICLVISCFILIFSLNNYDCCQYYVPITVTVTIDIIYVDLFTSESEVKWLPAHAYKSFSSVLRTQYYSGASQVKLCT
jgi:hypothetical protein